jgi:hypothetical protein
MSPLSDRMNPEAVNTTCILEMVNILTIPMDSNYINTANTHTESPKLPFKTTTVANLADSSNNIIVNPFPPPE